MRESAAYIFLSQPYNIIIARILEFFKLCGWKYQNRTDNIRTTTEGFTIKLIPT